MKKVFCAALCGIMSLLMCTLMCTAAFASDITLNGKRIDFPQQPVIENGTALVPMRAILEAMGAKVDWNKQAQSVIATIGNEYVVLTVNSKIASIGTTMTTLNTPPRLINGTMMVPVRFLCESFCFEINYNAETKDIEIIDNSYAEMPSIPDLGRLFDVKALDGSGSVVSEGTSATVSYSYSGITDEQLNKYIARLEANGFEKVETSDKSIYYVGSKGSSYIISIEQGKKTLITVSIFR